MTVEIMLEILTNAVLLMSLSVIYSVFPNDKNLSYIIRKTIMGLSVGLIGFIVMRNHVEIQTGIIFDGRSVVMLLSGMYFGLIPTILGAIPLMAYRAYVGGNGLIPGLLWIIIPGVIGLIWRRYRLKKAPGDMKHIKSYEQYLLILGNMAGMVLLLFFFPNKVPIEAINAVAIPLIVFYPIAGYLISEFMLRQRKSYFVSLDIKEREKEYNALFNNNATYTLVVDPKTMTVVLANKAVRDRYGYTEEEMIGLDVMEINLRPKSEIRELMRRVISKEIDYFTTKHRTKNNEVLDVEIRLEPLELRGKTFLYANIIDITSKLEQEKQFLDVNTRLDATLGSISDGVVVMDEYGFIQIANKVARQFIDAGDEVIGKSLSSIIKDYTSNTGEGYNKGLALVNKTKKPFITPEPFIFKTMDGETLYVNFSLSPIIYENDDIQGYILVFKDVTTEYLNKNKVQYVSQHDFLTGLYNRYFIEEEMKRLDTKRQLPISIILGDVNGLKLTNDTFGHNEGDALLIEIGSILKKATRSEDIIARWGGDEFLILLPQTSAENAEKVRERIIDLQKKSMYDVVIPSISLGIATKNDEGQELGTVLIEAEKEMYANKKVDGAEFRIELLTRLTDKMDRIHPELGTHATNVASHLKQFGEYMQMSKEDISILVNLATYHDIGWVGVDKDILIKTESLDAEEMDKIKLHTEIGFRIMKSIPKHSYLADLIASHHEKWDGSGYPNGLKGLDIPVYNRRLFVADAFDIMTSNTIYSLNKTKDEAFAELRANAGTQFDPDLVEKFIEMKEKE